MDELTAKHRKELKDLESRITQKKKGATKKTRKGVNEECETLRQETTDRHKVEVAALNGDDALPEDDQDAQDISTAVDQLHVDDPESSSISDAAQVQQQPSSSIPPQPPVKKVNRARARIERRRAEQEALFTSAAQEASSQPDLKRAERDRMVSNFTSRGLVEKEIRADGHCLYSAFADQMSALGLPLLDTDTSTSTSSSTASKTSKLRSLSNSFRRSSASQDTARLEAYKTVRASAAEYISAHPDDFAPFLEEPLPTHVHKIRDTAEWGGQLELTALAKTYGVTINVLQGDGRVEEIKPENENGSKTQGSASDKQIWLAYYRHGFGLGEHYNSLRPRDT